MAVRRLWPWVLGWCALFGLWLLLVDTLSGPELLAGSGAALIALVAGGRVCARALGLRPPLRDAAAAWSRPVAACRDSGIVLAAVVLQLLGIRRVHGRFIGVPFRARADDPRTAGRRALAAALTSFAPNTVVVGFDREQDVMIVHRLVATRSHPSGGPRRAIDGRRGARGR